LPLFLLSGAQFLPHEYGFPVMNGNVMSFFPPIEEPIGAAFLLRSVQARSEGYLPNPERIGEISGEFSRIDYRFLGEAYQWTL